MSEAAPKPQVTHIEFTLVADGKRRVVVFTRAEKIEALLNEQGSLGAFMREMRDIGGQRDEWENP